MIYLSSSVADINDNNDDDEDEVMAAKIMMSAHVCAYQFQANI